MTTPVHGNTVPPGVPSGSPGLPGGAWQRRLFGVVASALALAFVVFVVEMTRDEEMPGPTTSPEERATAMTASSPEDPRVARGAEVYSENGCDSCHSLDGSESLGPSLAGFWDTERVMTDGSLVRATRDYFYESVLDPEARVVRGFESEGMPSYEGLIEEEDLEALAAYVRSLQ